MNQKIENSENSKVANNHKHHNVSFMISAANYTDIKPSNDEEYAILGRSNVGKSSFINHVLENRNLARTSKKPGKTSLANFYRVEQQMVWVDLPGYGYAKVSGGERIRWSKLIASYCEKRTNLRGLIWLVDIRHIGAKADLEAYEWLNSLGLEFFLVLTKADKLTKQQGIAKVKESQKIFEFGSEPVTYSVNDHLSRARFWNSFNEWRNDVCNQKRQGL